MLMQLLRVEYSHYNLVKRTQDEDYLVFFFNSIGERI